MPPCSAVRRESGERSGEKGRGEDVGDEGADVGVAGRKKARDGGTPGMLYIEGVTKDRKEGCMREERTKGRGRRGRSREEGKKKRRGTRTLGAAGVVPGERTLGPRAMAVCAKALVRAAAW